MKVDKHGANEIFNVIKMLPRGGVNVCASNTITVQSLVHDVFFLCGKI